MDLRIREMVSRLMSKFGVNGEIIPPTLDRYVPDEGRNREIKRVESFACRMSPIIDKEAKQMTSPFDGILQGLRLDGIDNIPRSKFMCYVKADNIPEITLDMRLKYQNKIYTITKVGTISSGEWIPVYQLFLND